jgi:hypothetical protein
MRHLSILFLIFCFVQTALSQADCPAIVSAALDTATNACAELGRNQACYGNVTLQATPRADAPAFTFEQAGDVVNVTDIESLRLSSMSLTDETWGVALMQLQANLPDTLPGQNVTVLLFGDVSLSSAADTLTELDVTANANANVRLRPTTAESNVISSLTSGETITANGRLEDGSWVRIVLDAETNEVGWVSADLVNSETSLEILAIVDADGALLYDAPMQAFYFSSGIGDRPCSEAPDSGILIQTPQGVGTVILRINEVQIELGSTIYVQAGGGFMTVSVVEGHAVLTSNGVSQTVPAGTFAQIPLDSNGLANGAPTFPQGYSFSDLRALPVSVALPQTIRIASSIRGEPDIEVAISVADGLPPTGRWIFDEVFIEGGCEEGAPPDGLRTHFNLNMTFSDDRSSVIFDEEELADSITWSRIDDMTYGGSTNGSDMMTIVFTSPTTFTSTFVGASTNRTPECVVRSEGTGYFVGPLEG